MNANIPISTELPKFSADLSFNTSNSQILDLFTESCNYSSFQVIEKTKSQAIAVHKEHFSLYKVLTWCSPSQEVVSAAKLKIIVNPHKSSKEISLEGIYGQTQVFIELFKRFKHHLETLNSESLHSFENSEWMEDQKTNKHENSSCYQIYKLLRSEKYTIGRKLNSFIENHEITSEKLALEEIREVVETTIEELESDYNIGEMEMARFSRPTVEKYVFSKLLKPLLLIYKEKFRNEDSLLLEKKQEIIGLSNQDLMEKIGISQIFELESQFAYKESIEILSTLQLSFSPTEKLNVLLSVISSMRISVIDYWRNQYELVSMDDELPILSYIILKAPLKHLNAQINFLKDYIEDEEENELRILINFETCCEYIAGETFR